MVLSVGVVCALASLASAQQASPLTKGARVRAVLPTTNDQAQQHIVGALVRLESDTVVIVTGGGLAVPDTVTIALAGEGRLEVFAGSRNARTKGGRLGVLFGALGGAIIGAAASRQSESACFAWPCSRGETALAGALMGGALGGVAGMVIGSTVRSEIWAPVETANIRVALTRAGVVMSMRF